MAKRLTITESYRVNTDAEAKSLIEEVKLDSIAGGYTLTSYSSKQKEKKKKGEVIDQGYLVIVSKEYAPFFDEEL